MSWLKDVLVDITATVFIIAAVLLNYPLLTGILWVYTGLLLFVKLLVVVGDDFFNLMTKAKTDAPEWFSHLLYAINTSVLFYFHWWYVASGWLLIWILSFLTQRKIEQS